METVDFGNRQSNTASDSARSENQQRLEQQQPRHGRDPLSSRPVERSAMAAAALMPPNSAYHNHAPAFPSFSHSASTASVADMISPVEARRSSDETETAQRQSLPSISEVISVAKQVPYPPQPAPHPMPGSSLPPSFSSSALTPRYQEEKPSPRAAHDSSTFPPRQEALPAFSDAPRPIFSTRSGPVPLSVFRGAYLNLAKADQEAKSIEQQQANGSFSHTVPPPSALHPYTTNQLPPGQHPLPAYPLSPRHQGPHLPVSFDTPKAQTGHVEHGDFGQPRARYETTLSRHFEAWGYQESLSRIATSSRTIYNFAEAYGRIAQEQQGAPPIPERLPTEREVADMLACADYIKKSLEGLRDVVLTNIQERQRESKAKGHFEEEDVPMYDSTKSQYGGITEVKKRRGRAAPPGRCHSCNRQDTPEWRRGPDGARTLCNACGLHYAKLERKRQLEARSIRPRLSEERT